MQAPIQTLAVAGAGAEWALPASCLMWLDVADLGTVFQDAAMTTPVTTDGQTIRAIADKSGSAHHMIRFSDSYVGTYKAALKALNNPKYYRTPVTHVPGATNEFTYVFVGSVYTSSSTTSYCMEGGLHTQRTCLSFKKASSTAAQVLLHHKGTTTPRTITTYAADDYDMHFLIFADGVNNTEIRTWFNSGAVYSHTDFASPYDGGWSSNPYMRLGAAGSTYMDVCECMHWNRKLTDNERTQTRNHLLSKWSIA